MRRFNHAERFIEDVAKNGRSHPAYTTVGWWKPGDGRRRDADVLMPWLYFDIDCKESLLEAAKDAYDTVDRLVGCGFDPSDGMYVSFSGGKGFHVQVPTAQLGLPYFIDALHAKKTWNEIFDEWTKDLHLDTSPFSPLTLIRLTGSVHADTSNRKWSVRAADFDVGEALELIEMQMGGFDLKMKHIRESDTLIHDIEHPFDAELQRGLASRFAEVWAEMRSRIQKIRDGDRSGVKTTSTNNRTVMPEPVYRAFQGVSESERFGVGHAGRDKAAFLLACHFLRKGHSLERTLDLLEKWDRQRNDPPMQTDPGERDGVLTIKVNSAARTLYEDGDLPNLKQL